MSNPPEGGAATSPRRGSRHLHAFLDSVFPGLGHLVAGRRRRAALFGVPTLVTIVVGVGGLVFIPTARLLGIALDPATVAVLFFLQMLLLVWRAAAIGSSLVDGRFPRLARRDALPIAILAVVLVAPQAFAAYATEVAREATDQIIPIDPTTAGAWDPSGSASAVPDPEVTLPSELPGAPSIGPSASPSPAVARQNVLLVGVDAGIGRNTYLTDTMIVASLDPVAQTVSMISIPRDMVDVPLPDGRKFSGKINSLVSFARHHQATFPGSNGDGYDVLMGALARSSACGSTITPRSTSVGSSLSSTPSAGSMSTSPRASATRPTTSTGSPTDSGSRPVATTSTASRPSAMPGSGRQPARATSPGRLASRRSCRAFATG